MFLNKINTNLKSSPVANLLKSSGFHSPTIALVSQRVKYLPAMWETWVQSLGWKDPLEKGKAAHYNILACRIPWTIQSMWSQRVGHNWVTSLHFTVALAVPLHLDLKPFLPPGLWVAQLSVQSCLTSVSSPVSPAKTSRGLRWLLLIEQCLMNGEVMSVEGCQASWDHSACWPIPMTLLVQIVKTIMFLSFPRAAWWIYFWHR